MRGVLILAQSVIDEGFFEQCDFGCYVGFAATGGVLIGLGFVVTKTRRRAEDAYWQRKRREAERRAEDPDMARTDDAPPVSEDNVEGPNPPGS